HNVDLIGLHAGDLRDHLEGIIGLVHLNRRPPDPSSPTANGALTRQQLAVHRVDVGLAACLRAGSYPSHYNHVISSAMSNRCAPTPGTRGTVPGRAGMGLLYRSPQELAMTRINVPMGSHAGEN